MNRIKAMRSEMGLDQHELAVYLGISRSMMSMVERGQRQMPHAAMNKLMQLRIGTAKNKKSASKKASEQKLNEKDKQKLMKMLQRWEQRLMNRQRNIQRELRRCTRREEHNRKRAQTLTETNALGIAPKPWQAMMEWKIKDDARKSDALSAALLEIRLKMIEAELGELKQIEKQLLEPKG